MPRTGLVRRQLGTKTKKRVKAEIHGKRQFQAECATSSKSGGCMV